MKTWLPPALCMGILALMISSGFLMHLVVIQDESLTTMRHERDKAINDLRDADERIEADVIAEMRLLKAFCSLAAVNNQNITTMNRIAVRVYGHPISIY